ncbi:hypothetical protein MRX96_019053 [Rhipicephalus microplus]
MSLFTGRDFRWRSPARFMDPRVKASSFAFRLYGWASSRVYTKYGLYSCSSVAVERRSWASARTKPAERLPRLIIRSVRCGRVRGKAVLRNKSSLRSAAGRALPACVIREASVGSPRACAIVRSLRLGGRKQDSFETSTKSKFATWMLTAVTRCGRVTKAVQGPENAAVTEDQRECGCTQSAAGPG